MIINNMDKFNSMTKFPSIPTYHELGEKGRLTTKLQHNIPHGTIIGGTEKVDGTNTRITATLLEDGYDFFIGSRDDWITAMGDRIHVDSLGIVDAVLYGLDIEEKIETLSAYMESGVIDIPNGIYTIHGETYGGKINGFKHYTKSSTLGFRVFDISYISEGFVQELAERPIADVAHWRDHGGQRYLDDATKTKICEIMGLEQVPYLFTMNSEDLPTTLEDTYEFLMKYTETRAGIDNTGIAEGIVIRNTDRTIIAKIREEDYRRTLTPAPTGGKKR